MNRYIVYRIQTFNGEDATVLVPSVGQAPNVNQLGYVQRVSRNQGHEGIVYLAD